MTSARKDRGPLKSVDPIWTDIIEGAERIVATEPALAGFVVSTVLNHDSFEMALAHRLAACLGHPDVSADLVRQAFEDVLDQHPHVGVAARTDLTAILERDPACDRAIVPLLYFKGFQAIQSHRFAHALFKSGRKDFAFYLQARASMMFQVDIHPRVPLGRGVMLDHGTGIVIGETAVVGDNVSILQGVTLGGTGKEDGDRHPKVGCGVLLGAGAKVLGNITIGDCARVAAGSVVLKDVPARVTVAGVPAKIVGEAGCDQPGTAMDQMFGATRPTHAG